MGEYRFSAYAKCQIGFGIEYDGQLVIRAPFVEIRFALSKHAKGVLIFGKEL